MRRGLLWLIVAAAILTAALLRGVVGADWFDPVPNFIHWMDLYGDRADNYDHCTPYGSGCLDWPVGIIWADANTEMVTGALAQMGYGAVSNADNYLDTWDDYSPPNNPPEHYSSSSGSQTECGSINGPDPEDPDSLPSPVCRSGDSCMRHTRIYAWNDDHFENSEWGDYVLATTHYDVNHAGCDPDHLDDRFGESETVEQIIVAQAAAHGFAVTYRYKDMHNPGDGWMDEDQTHYHESDGYASLIEFVNGMSKSPASTDLWYCEGPPDSPEVRVPFVALTEHECDPNLGEGARYITEYLRNQAGVGLGGFSFEAAYSPLVFVSAAIGGEEGFLASTGRAVSCSEEWDPSYTVFSYSCGSSGAQPGPTGDGDLMDLSVRPRMYGELYRPTRNTNVDVVIDDAQCHATDVQGLPLPGSDGQGYLPTCSDAWVTLRMLEGDVTSNCEVSFLDCQEVAFRFGTAVGNQWYREWDDLCPEVPDGRIGLKDVQFTCGRWGSTCQQPVPCDQAGLICLPGEGGLASLMEGEAVVAVDPPSQDVPLGESFTLDLVVEGADNLGGYEFTLEFDPGVISYVGVEDGSFLTSTGREIICPAEVTDQGVLTFGCGTIGTAIGAPSGSGQLAQVTFEAVGEGITPLTLTAVDLMDPLAEDVPSVGDSGSVSVVIPDSDSDGIPDGEDNCPVDYNPDQTNTDAVRRPNGEQVNGEWASNPATDILGDACDEDDDNDALPDGNEDDLTCPYRLVTDSDGDRSMDGYEIANGKSPCNGWPDTPACTDPTDTDGDGFSDCIEHLGYNTCASVGDPTPGYSECTSVVDYNGDTVLDSTDSDADGCADWIEIVDINGDRAANLTDVNLVVRRAFNVLPPSDSDPVFDINKDRFLNLTDPVLAARNSNLVKTHLLCPAEP